MGDLEAEVWVVLVTTPTPRMAIMELTGNFRRFELSSAWKREKRH
jgi:hypothetical protein